MKLGDYLWLKLLDYAETQNFEICNRINSQKLKSSQNCFNLLIRYKMFYNKHCPFNALTDQISCDFFCLYCLLKYYCLLIFGYLNCVNLFYKLFLPNSFKKRA